MDSLSGTLAWRCPSAWAVLLITLTLGLFADLTTKRLAFEFVAPDPIDLPSPEIVGNAAFRLPWHDGVQVLPGDLLDFRLVLNHGAIFGIGQQQRSVFVLFTCAAVAVGLWIFGTWTTRRSTLAHIGLGLVLAGGLGNLYDRLFVGAVRDFLYLMPRWNLPFGWSWPNAGPEVFPWIFNVADMLLLAGMTILIIYSRREDQRRASELAEKAAEVTPLV
ncbi:MAG: signal peptidase II [Planctomycetota bacterium]|nr:signal peptidase II [Planctomycetota bacterium]